MIAAGGSDLREVHSVVRLVTLDRRDEPRLLRALRRRRRRRSPLSLVLTLSLFLPSYGAIPLRDAPEIEQKSALPNTLRVVADLALKSGNGK